MSTQLDKGEIEPQPISVGFKKSLRTDGAVVAVTIKQNDQFLYLTEAQAKSLAKQIQEKLP